MKRLLTILCLLLSSLPALPQNWTSVAASNITDLNQNKLAAGQLCFVATDQNDNPISFSVGGGGQVLKRAFCSSVAAGAVTAFTVPNPASTQPAGVYYRVTVKDTSTGQEVLRYTQVTFTGGSFSFDNYAPVSVGGFAPLTGNAVSGNLSVNGNANITGSLTVGSFNPTVVTSGQLISNTANPAGAGILRLASGDSIDWRNNANSANVPLQKTGAASGGVPADTLDASGFGGLKLASPAISGETAAPSGITGADILYADSTAHRWKMINNNNAIDTVVGAATTDTLTNKTLTAAAINSPTTTGTDNGSETLQNKTLTGAGSGNSVTLLNVQGPAAAITGTGADMTIYTYTLPGNALGPGRCMVVKARVMHSAGTASATFKMIIGSTTITSNNYANANNFNEDRTTLTICNNPGVQNSQYYEQEGLFNQSGSSSIVVNGNTNPSNTSSIDFTSLQIIKFTVNAATTDQIAPRFWIVESVQ